jgi:hypothetical protein
VPNFHANYAYVFTVEKSTPFCVFLKFYKIFCAGPELDSLKEAANKLCDLLEESLISTEERSELNLQFLTIPHLYEAKTILTEDDEGGYLAFLVGINYKCFSIEYY